MSNPDHKIHTSYPFSMEIPHLNLPNDPVERSISNSQSVFSSVPDHIFSSNSTSHCPTQRNLRLPLIDPLERFRKILKTTDRDQKDLEFLYKQLQDMDFLSIFGEYSTESQETESILHICKHLGFEQLEPGEVILREGDPSNGKFYLIFSGEVSIIVKKLDFVTQRNLELKQPELEVEVEVEDDLNNSLQYLDVKTNQKGEGNLKNNSHKQIPEPQRPALQKRTTKMEFDPQILVRDYNRALSIRAVKHLNLQKINLMSPQPDEAAGKSTSRTDSQEKESSKSPAKNSSSQAADKGLDMHKLATEHGEIIYKLKKGAFFGEKALLSSGKRTATVMANTPCELITVSEDVFSYVREHLDKINLKKLNFMMNSFPGIEKIQYKPFLQNLLYLLEEKPVRLSAALTTEGQKSTNFYVLYEGVCNVYKKLPSNNINIIGDQQKDDGVLICQISPGSFIGEEVIFNKMSKYEYTVRAASSKVVALEIDRAKFAVRFPNYVLLGVNELYQTKINHYKNISIERAKMKSEIDQLAKSPSHKKFKSTLDDILIKDPKSSINIAQESPLTTQRTVNPKHAKNFSVKLESIPLQHSGLLTRQASIDEMVVESPRVAKNGKFNTPTLPDTGGLTFEASDNKWKNKVMSIRKKAILEKTNQSLKHLGFGSPQEEEAKSSTLKTVMTPTNRFNGEPSSLFDLSPKNIFKGAVPAAFGDDRNVNCLNLLKRIINGQETSDQLGFYKSLLSTSTQELPLPPMSPMKPVQPEHKRGRSNKIVNIHTQHLSQTQRSPGGSKLALAKNASEVHFESYAGADAYDGFFRQGMMTCRNQEEDIVKRKPAFDVTIPSLLGLRNKYIGPNPSPPKTSKRKEVSFNVMAQGSVLPPTKFSENKHVKLESIIKTDTQVGSKGTIKRDAFFKKRVNLIRKPIG